MITANRQIHLILSGPDIHTSWEPGWFVGHALAGLSHLGVSRMVVVGDEEHDEIEVKCL